MAKSHKKWSDLKAKHFSPERVAELHREAMQEMVDYDLRAIRELAGKTQGEVAEAMDTAQSGVSRIEGREDLKLSTLRSYVEALGGRLDVIATIGDKTVRLQSL